MKKLLLITLLANSLFAVSYGRDIQPMIDFRKEQKTINQTQETNHHINKLNISKLNIKVSSLEKRILELEKLIKKLSK